MRSQEVLGDHAPKILAYLVMLCFEKRYPQKKLLLAKNQTFSFPQTLG